MSACRNILRAARQGSLSDLQMLLSTSPGSVNEQNSKKETAISLAVGSGFVDMVDYLMTTGANMQHISVGNDTLLHLAVRNKHANVIKRLLDAKIPVNAPNVQQMSALHLCAVSGDLDVFKMLLAHGSDLNQKARFDYTPLLLAVEYRHLHLIRYILQRGADMLVPVAMTNHPIQKILSEPAVMIIFQKERVWRRRRLAVWLGSGRAIPSSGHSPCIVQLLPAHLLKKVICYL